MYQRLYFWWFQQIMQQSLGLPDIFHHRSEPKPILHRLKRHHITGKSSSHLWVKRYKIEHALQIRYPGSQEGI